MADLFSVTDNLWIAQSCLYATNSGIFLFGDNAGLVDPALFPEELDAIEAFLARRRAIPRWIVLTHHHWDHVLGPDRFPDVPVVAHANFLEEMGGPAGRRTLEELERWEAENEISRPLAFQVPVPDETFAGQTSIALGELRLDLIHAPGHAADQLVLVEPHTATLWAADMLSDLEIPFVSHSLAAYQQTLAHLAETEIRVLVPGHGRPTDDVDEIQTRLREDREYLDELRRRVADCVEDGRSLDGTWAGCEGMVFRRAEENTAPHRLNVESVYMELGGMADPVQAGWNQKLGG